MWIDVNEMPSPITSELTTRLQASSAALEATYAANRGGFVWTPIDEMLTTWPPPVNAGVSPMISRMAPK